MDVSLTPRQSFHVREGRVEVSCTEIYYTEFNIGGQREWMPNPNELVRLSEPWLTNTEISQGIPYRTQITFHLPGDAPCTVKGEIVDISWQLGVSLEVTEGGNIRDGQSLIVDPLPLIPPEPPPVPVTTESSFEDCNLSISLPSDLLGSGEIVNGTLSIHPWFDLSYPSLSEIRVEVVYDEKVIDRELRSTYDKVVLHGDDLLSANQTQQWPFQLTVPANIFPPPNVETENTSANWRVVGIVETDTSPSTNRGTSVAASLFGQTATNLEVRQIIQVYQSEPVPLGAAEEQLNAGMELQQQGRIHEAVSRYDEAIRLDSNIADAYANRALALTFIGRDELALEDIEMTVALGADRASLETAIEEFKHPE